MTWQPATIVAVLLVPLALLVNACAPTGVYHVVEPGQTLYRIARTYDVSEAYLARANRIEDPTRLEVGRHLFIPGAKVPRNVPTLDPPRAPAPPSLPTPPAKSVKPAKSPPARAAGKEKLSRQKPETGEEAIPGLRPAPGTFVWPVKGPLVTDFGTTAGKSSKGIEIAVPHGTPVAAAAAGKVIYSGSGIRGYGNLVILEHSGNYFTVYGYNAKNLVAVDAYLGQGDKVALSGTPSGGKSPRLHFEIRKGKTAVNPIFFLP